jgi:hypothetical protein
MSSARSLRFLLSSSLIAAYLMFSLSAIAQSKPSPDGFGLWMLNSTLQQTKSHQELRETKQELKALREGLGIEGPYSDAPQTSPAMAILMAIAAIAFVACLLFFSLKTWAHKFTKLRQDFFNAKKSGDMWAAYWILCNPSSIAGQIFQAGLLVLAFLLFGDLVYVYFTRPEEQSWSVINGFLPGRLFAAAWVYGIFICLWFPGLWYYTKRILQASCANGNESTRLVATSERTDAEGPLVSLAQLQAQGSDLVPTAIPPRSKPNTKPRMFWVRTPQGKRGGPYSKEQIVRAIVAGRIPVGAEIAYLPDGPWRPLAARQS